MSSKKVRRSNPSRKPIPISIGLIALAVLLVTALIAKTHEISGLENELFRFVNDLPGSQRTFWLLMSGLGSVYTFLGCILLLIITKYYHLALRLFGYGSVALFCSQALKLVIARPRPAELLSHVQIRQFMMGNGFPSTHTALATVMALVLLYSTMNRHRWLWMLWVGMVGLSRLYLGVHLPLDIVGGFTIGVAVVSLLGAWRDKLRLVTKITRLKLAKTSFKS